MDPASIILLSLMGLSFAGSCCAIYHDARADEIARIRRLAKRRQFYFSFGQRKQRAMQIPSPVPEGIE